MSTQTRQLYHTTAAFLRVGDVITLGYYPDDRYVVVERTLSPDATAYNVLLNRVDDESYDEFRISYATSSTVSIDFGFTMPVSSETVNNQNWERFLATAVVVNYPIDEVVDNCYLEFGTSIYFYSGKHRDPDGKSWLIKMTNLESGETYSWKVSENWKAPVMEWPDTPPNLQEEQLTDARYETDLNPYQVKAKNLKTGQMVRSNDIHNSVRRVGTVRDPAGHHRTWQIEMIDPDGKSIPYWVYWDGEKMLDRVPEWPMEFLLHSKPDLRDEALELVSELKEVYRLSGDNIFTSLDEGEYTKVVNSELFENVSAKI